MATYIARPAIDTGNIRARIESLEPELANLFSRLGTKNVFVERVFDDSLMLGGLRCAIDPTAESAATRTQFATSLDAGAALFAACDGPAEPVDHSICGHTFSLKRTGPRRYHRAGKWLTSLWLSIVFRDVGKTSELASVPVSALRESGAEYDEFIYLWVDSLQKFFQGVDDLEGTFSATMDSTNPANVSIASEEVFYDLLYPPIEMFYYILRRDSQKFNESLERALRAHQRYWSQHDRVTDARGMIALSPLGLAVLAQQSRMSIEIESEYLPRHLLLGEGCSRQS